MDEQNNSHLEDGQELMVQKRMLTPFLSKKVPPIPTEEERKPHPELTANLISRLFFWWLFPILKVGYKRTIRAEDMFYLPEYLTVERNAASFVKIYTRRVEAAMTKHVNAKCKQRGESPDNTSVDPEDDLKGFSVPPAVTVLSILETFKYRYSFACLSLVLANTAGACNPLLTKKLINFVEERTLGLIDSPNKGIGYAFGASLMVLIMGVFINHTFYNALLTGAQTKALLTKVMLDKSFRLNAESKSKFSTATITSLMGTDVARIDLALGFQPFLFVFPVPCAIAIALLIVNVGPSALVGIFIVVFFMLFVIFCSKFLFQYRAKANKYTDARVGYIKEVLNNLKIIKFYCWEDAYYETIADTRKKEMKIIFRMQSLRNILFALTVSMTLVASLSTFLVLYRLRTNGRTAADIFSSISLFNMLTQQVIMIPFALSTGADAFIGLKRLGNYLNSAEVDPESIKIEASEEKAKEMDLRDLSVEVKNGCFEWEVFHTEEDEDEKKEPEKESKESVKESSTELEKIDSKALSNSDSESPFPGLQNINLEIKKGEFVVITGIIGSGKSSLLSALSGFMKRVDGEIAVNGDLLLCGAPWVQNATVKDNVLFGQELDEERYKEVIYACSLESDLAILPAGDKTEIGERGITLSGGQKARINLARAVYAENDIILLDDVLSAVDARVGKHIMNNCIMGLLKERTRVLATHQLSLIGSADKIIFLNGDGSISTGTLEELKASNAGFSNLMAYNNELVDKEKEEEKEEVEEVEEQEKYLIERQVSKTLTHHSHMTEDEEAMHHDFTKNKLEDGTLFRKEERAINGISSQVYKNYIKLGSGYLGMWGMIFCIFSTCVITTFCQLFTNTWLSFWTEYKFSGRTDGFYIGFYVMFTVLAMLFLVVEFNLFVVLSNFSSKNMNILAVKKILHAPMSYMDTTPMGRILNRFTKDTDALDNEMSNELRMLFFFLFNICGVLVLCMCYLPWFTIAVPFLVLVFVATANFFQASARETKRLEALQRSMVYNNFNETLSGMNTIKAYKAAYQFTLKNDHYINKMSEAYFITIGNQRWLAIHLDIVATLFALLITLLCIFRVFNISAASTGLLLSYVLQIAGQLSMLIRTLTQIENEMNSVERMCEYAFELPEEAPYVISETTTRPTWPEEGSITFRNASLAYRPGLPLVLKNISVSVEGSQKIGICGRTGAGKSSIMTALYRLAELQLGKIEIDGVDISTLGLKNLRSALSIIPQDPILFKGSIRKNLDPFGYSTDDKLWDSLRRAGLIEESKLETVKKQVPNSDVLNKFHLEQEVEDEGSNFSLGERQLIAFARALARDSKILILDEATSSVDYETDSKIQSTIVREFSQCTILCIAHRLKTILNYDKILVLDKGQIEEFDTPWNLFKSDGSIFQQMCERSNITEADFNQNAFNV